MKKLLTLLLSCVSLSATTYYVRTDGNNGNTGTANTSGGAWLTIDYAADHTSAGDIVRVQAGTYGERLSPSQSGSSGNTITLVADGSVTFCGADFSGQDYIRFIGFVVDGNAGGCTAQYGAFTFSGVSEGIEVWNCTFRDALDNAIRVAGPSNQLNNSILIGNYVVALGVAGDGSAVGFSMHGTNCIIAYNEIAEIYPDAFAMPGNTNVWMNNYLHGMSEARGGHPDGWQVGSGYNGLGWEYNTFEANYQVGEGAGGNEHVAQISYGQGALPAGCYMRENVWRNNVFHALGGGGIGINQTFDGQVSQTWLYNNSDSDLQLIGTTSYGGHYFLHAGTVSVYAYNSIEVNSWGSARTANLCPFFADNGAAAVTMEYNLAYDIDGTVSFNAAWTGQANEKSNVDPGWINYAADNFRINNTGGAYHAAGPLTLVNEPSDTSGTSFDVLDASPFRPDFTAGVFALYGGNLWQGDQITIGTDVRRIVSISGNIITVDSTLTWANNDPVYFGGSTTPDLGALPYGHTPLSAATISSVGTTYTVTPTGDTRYVIFYQDGIPHTVDNASPFTATISSGVVTAKAYALYAQTTPYVTASDGGGGGAATRASASGKATLTGKGKL